MAEQEETAPQANIQAEAADSSAASTSPSKAPAKSGGWRAILLGSDLPEPVVRKSTPPLIRKKESTSDRRKALLQKIEARRIEKSKLPAPLTKAELAHRAALQRLPEIVAVLSFLASKGRRSDDGPTIADTEDEEVSSASEPPDQSLSSVSTSSVSISMPNYVTKVKDSLQNPISREEAELCINVLTADIAPDWVEIVSFGSVKAIVVKSGLQPSQAKLEGKIKAEIDRLEQKTTA